MFGSLKDFYDDFYDDFQGKIGTRRSGVILSKHTYHIKLIMTMKRRGCCIPLSCKGGSRDRAEGSTQAKLGAACRIMPPMAGHYEDAESACFS